MPILRGKNVLLRPYRRSDLPGILSWTNDTEATRYLTEIFDQPYTEKNGEDFLNYALSGGSERMMFVMADPVTEEYWGQISLERWRGAHGRGLGRAGRAGVRDAQQDALLSHPRDLRRALSGACRPGGSRGLPAGVRRASQNHLSTGR